MIMIIVAFIPYGKHILHSLSTAIVA